MTAPGSGGLGRRNGRSDPIGPRAIIKGSGRARGGRALIFEEPREATAALLCGDVIAATAAASKTCGRGGYARRWPRA